MDIKNKIKIDSFEICRMTKQDIPEILKLAVLAQSSFGLSDQKAPSAFLDQMNRIVSNNIDFSFVYKADGKIFAAFIIKAETSISAEIALAVSDPNVIQTTDMYDYFYKWIFSSQFKVFYAKVYKRRKKFEAYVRFLNVYGFNEKTAEDEDFLTLSLKKP